MSHTAHNRRAWDQLVERRQRHTKPALDLAFAPRGDVELPKVVRQDVPEINLKAAAQTIASPNPPPAAPAETKKRKAGCGCQTGEASGGLMVFALLALVLRRKP